MSITNINRDRIPLQVRLAQREYRGQGPVVRPPNWGVSQISLCIEELDLDIIAPI